MRTRTELILGIIGVFIGILLVIYYVAAFNRRNTELTDLVSSRSTTPTITSTDGQNTNHATGQVTLDTATIAQHNSSTDCWLLIDTTVYDVASYLKLHPGGIGIILPFCGEDATTAFLTKDGRGSHSSVAMQDLSQFAIGSLGSTIGATTLQQLQTNAQSTPLPTRGEREFDDD